MLLQRLRQFLPFFAFLFAAWPLVGAPEVLRVALITDSAQVRAGDSFRVGVLITIEEGWYIYGEDPGLTGLPTTVEWELPEGVTAGPVQYPPTVSFDFLGETSDGYKNSVVLWSEIETPLGWEGPLELVAKLSWLVCRDICIPGDGRAAAQVSMGRATVLDEELAGLFAAAAPSGAVPAELREQDGATDGDEAAISLPYFLLIGFVGGLILNLMPCVFPILGLKIMGFVNQAGEDRRKVVLHGLVFSGGVLLSFWILAGLLLVLRAGGQELGWGFQLQEPGFVLVLTAVLLLFGLNMSGVFEFGLSAIGVGSHLTAKGGMTGSFFSGVLATVVATPCAAPFLAPALGTALILPPVASIGVFTAIAVGLALPYLSLSAFPGLVRMLPRPGAWMETFKQFMSFLLYGTVAYLLWVLAGQVGATLLLEIFFAFVVVAMGCWVYGRWAAPHRKRRTQWIARLATVALILGPLGYIWTGIAEQERRQSLVAAGNMEDQDFLVWEPWTPEREGQLREAGRSVYIDFTARWCATCQVNKRAYENPEVIRAFLENDVALLIADWTSKDPTITRALAAFNRSAIPFNLIYSPGANEPLIMPELFGAGTVLDKLREAGVMAD
jgi:thiol:disulfide interchange protein DsbD